MNLGVYFKSIGVADHINEAIENVNEGIEEGLLTDASLFYDAIGPTEKPPKFGIFNSTDIWAFTGNLITTCTETTAICSNIVNKFKLFFYYNPTRERNTLALIDSLCDENVKVICASEEDSKELFRITGKKPVAVVEKFNIKDIIKAVNNE